MADYALQDVTVIDFSEGVAGPYCTRLLAGLGAEVIKVERPGGGDAARGFAPFLPGTDPLECGALFHHLNAGKKSITLDLGVHRGQDLSRELVRRAQVVVDSSAPGVQQRRGLSYASLSGDNPALVMISISSFGQSGPYRDYIASDFTSLAMGGLLYTCGEPDREPVKIGGAQASYIAGVSGCIATVGALLEAEVSGEGQWIDVSVMEAVASVLEATTVDFSRDGGIRRRQGNRHGRSYPMTILPCKDGYVGVMIAGDADWELFARLVDEAGLVDPRFALAEGRSRHADEIEAIVYPYLLRHTREELFHWAQELRLPFSVVLTPDELLDDPQHQKRNFFAVENHPSAGEVLQVGPPFRTMTGWKRGRAPLLGEHTAPVLMEMLGLGEGELATLRRDRVI